MAETEHEHDGQITRQRVREFIGSRANFAGLGVGVVGLLASADFARKPLLILAITAATYAGGYLLGKDYSKDVTFELESHSDRVEVHEIQKNLSSLRVQVERQRHRIPKSIMSQLDETFKLIEDLLPRWSQLKSFTEQKYTINAIVTDYLPTIIANYLNLPASYYYNAAKKQFGAEAENQLKLLNESLTKIQNDIFKNTEQNILVQSRFLETKFASDKNSLLRLEK